MIPMKKSGRRMPLPVRAVLALVLFLVLACPAQALASSYSLLGEGKLTPVKNQGAYGIGWAFSAVSAIESNQLIKYGTTEDYSELHLGYSAFNNTQADTLGGTAGDTISCLGWTFASVGSTHLHGALPSQAVTALATWRGLVDDATAPYSGAATADAGTSPVANPYANVTAHLQNSYSVPLGDRAAVQALITQMGGATILFYADDNTYNSTTHAWYNGTYSIFNDAVTLVGWDDDYSADNFGGASGTGAKPTSNGAWLVRGNRGSSWGDGGYFWLSYEDASLTQISPLVLSLTGSSTPDAYFYDVEPATNYDHNYQYDGGTTTVWYSLASGSATANVYTATSAQDVDAVGFFTKAANVGYSVSVYANPTSAADPSSGTLVASASGTETYAGYHTVALDDPATLSKGETFAVVVTLTSADGANVWLAADKTTGTAEEYVTDTLSQTTQTMGQSFRRVGPTGSSWIDMASDSATARIKAFTTDVTSFSLSYHTAMTGVTAPDPEGAGSFREMEDSGAYVMLNETSGTSDDQPKLSGTDIGTSTVVSGDKSYSFVGWSNVAPSANANFAGSSIGDTDYLCTTTDQLSAAGVVSYLVMPSSTQDVYAVWKVVPTIRFDANGGVFADGATTAKTATLGTICDPSDITTPTRDGYTFIGWYAAAGSGLGADQGDKATDTVVSADGQTFYAAWAKTTSGTGTTAPETSGVITASPLDSSVTFTNYPIYPSPTLDISIEKLVRSTIGASVTMAADTTFSFSVSGSAVGPDGTTAITCPLPSSTSSSVTIASGIIVQTTYGTTPDSTATFDTVTFTQPGTYTYEVSEDQMPTGSPWGPETINQNLNRKLTVVVVADNTTGALSVGSAVWENAEATRSQATIAEGGASVSASTTYANGYFSSVTLDTSTTAGSLLTKNVTGTGFDSTSFGFAIEPGLATYPDGTSGTAPASSSDSGSATFDAAGSKNVSFGTITFTKAGTYLYSVHEVAPTVEDARWTLDTSPKTVEVDVADDGNGALTATVETAASISNSFAYEPLTVDTAAAGFATKTVTGATSYADKNFDFTITGVASTGGGPESSIGTESAVAGTATLAAGGDQRASVDFGDITFYRPGSYAFNVEETTADGGGWTCDHETHSVTVDVSGNADGSLSAVVTTPATITNSYLTTPVSITPSVGTTISVANGTPTFPASFTHAIAAQTAGAPMPTQATATTTFDSLSAAPGPVSFGTITFTKAGTYQYALSEQQLPAGWSNLSGVTTMTVVVTDVNGALQAVVTAGGTTITPTSSSAYTPQSTSELLVTTFENEYSAGTVTVDASRFAVQKAVTGDETAVDTTFWFELKAASTTAVGLNATSMPLPEGATGAAAWLSVVAPAGTASGAVVSDVADTFGSISYTTPGTYTYEVKEVAADGSDVAPTDGGGWAYDSSSHTVVVTVTDDGAGLLSSTTTVDGSETNGIAFANGFSYTPATLTTAHSVAQVQVVSDTSVPGATFQLTIAGTDGTPDPVRPDGSPIPSVTVGATVAGTYDVDFGEMGFSKPGTYVYRISQSEPGVGWTLENSPLTVTVKVQSDENGVLSAAVVGAPGTIKDRYATSVTLDTAVDVLLTKTVSGTGFSPASFGFSLTPTNGAPAATGTSGMASFDTAGSKPVFFGTIEFTKAGTYAYQVSETTALGSGWTCAGATQTATVTVTDTGEGVLVAKVTTPATIENGYSGEVVPTPTPSPSDTGGTASAGGPLVPNTGDSTGTVVPIMFALAGGIALLVARRRQG